MSTVTDEHMPKRIKPDITETWNHCEGHVFIPVMTSPTHFTDSTIVFLSASDITGGPLFFRISLSGMRPRTNMSPNALA